MPDKLKEYVRESLDRIVASLPAEKRLAGLTAEEVIRALPSETLEELKRQLKANGSSSGPK
jgi:hypothetical protein